MFTFSTESEISYSLRLRCLFFSGPLHRSQTIEMIIKKNSKLQNTKNQRETTETNERTTMIRRDNVDQSQFNFTNSPMMIDD